MLVRYTLITENDSWVIPSQDLANWDEIECSYKRADLSGVVRSFSTDFEFVGRTKEILWGMYLENGVNAKAYMKVFALTEKWEWEQLFMCDLDFSTMSLESGALKINCIDNSISALIKANKSTKYEFELGKDIPASCILELPRVPLIESATYEFTSGSQYSDGSLTVRFKQDEAPWVGLIGDPDLTNGGLIYCANDQKPESDYCIRNTGSEKATVSVSYSLRVSLLRLYGTADIVLMKHIGNAKTRVATLVAQKDMVRNYPVYGDVPWCKKDPGIDPVQSDQYMIIDGYVYKSIEQKFLPIVGEPARESIYRWASTHKLETDDMYSQLFEGEVEVVLNPGDKLEVCAVIGDGFVVAERTFLYGQNINFKWQAAAKKIKANGISPHAVLNAILAKIIGNDSFEAHISDFDNRIQNTYIFPGESIRSISGAKLYTTFNDFCAWMECVFGYVYNADSVIKPPKYNLISDYQDTLSFELSSDPRVYETKTPYAGAVSADMVYYDATKDRFVCKGSDGKYYYHWDSEYDYNSKGIILIERSLDIDSFKGNIRKDVIFHSLSDGGYAYYEKQVGIIVSSLRPYEYDERDWRDTLYHNVTFLHRSELFNPEEAIRISNVTDVTVSISTSNLYSNVSIGYKKQSYDSASGRDEFNFTNNYVTGCTVTDKKLTLTSSYRADSYGVEFCAQKMGKDTTDSEADKDVFFILCSNKDESGCVTPDYSMTIHGVLSDRVFNGAFSPVHCVMANAGRIAMTSSPKEMNLKFTSCDGNADVRINDMAMNADILLADALAMAAEIEFVTSEFTSSPLFSELYEISHEGYLYRGYLLESKVHLAKNSTVKCKLLIKEILPC